MEIQQIESFVEVAKFLNFSKAAEKLHITQSTMSARIQKLENLLGVSLFNRLGKSIRLSRYGEIFLPYAMQCMDVMEQGVKKIAEEKNSVLTQLTISSANPFGMLILPHLLLALDDIIPNARIQVLRSTGYSQEILQMVINAQIDIGIFNSGIISGSSLDSVCLIPLYEDDSVLLANAKHKLAGLPGITPQDLSESRFVMMGRKTSVAQHMIQYFERHQLAIGQTAEINSIGSIKEMLKKKEVMAILPRLLVAQEIEQGEMVEIPIYPAIPPLYTYLAYQYNQLNPNLISMIKSKVTSTINELKLPCRAVR